MTAQHQSLSNGRWREIARVRETLADYFYGSNQYASTPASWRSYFSVFTFAARKEKKG